MVTNQCTVKCSQISPLEESSALHFENLVFPGGGNRCFWQAGFWVVLAKEFNLNPLRATAVSAGAAIACALFSGGFDQGFQRFKQAVADNESNFHLRDFLHKRPLFPHGTMYRNAILASINESTLQRLQADGPEISVIVSCPPGWASPTMALMLGMIANGVETLFVDSVHSMVGRRLGFTAEFISVSQCDTPEALANLILASSCIPPLIPLVLRNGVALLDGGLSDNVPLDIVSEKEGMTLVLLTRQFKKLPTLLSLVYVQKYQPVPASFANYADEKALQSSFDLGRSDAESFCVLVRHSEG
jgi:predicted acylesterase/phospholipase RssA